MNEPNPGLSETTRPFTFAVVGDLHFGLPSAQTELPLGAAHRDPSTIERFAENVDYALVPMVEALRDEDLAFVVQTGDLTARENDEVEVREALRCLGRAGVPVLYARGDRDEAAGWDRLVRPRVDRALGDEGTGSYYTAEVGGCHLIVLDTSVWDPEGAQAAWFEAALDGAAERGGPVFVFGHHPVWSVARAFFTHRPFAEHVSSVLAARAVDAYFCGHTHHQNVVLHRSGDHPCLQCCSAPIGHPDELPTPLDRVQSLLVEEDDTIECWPGYLENTAPGWFLVHVADEGIDLSWVHLNRGAEAQVTWQKPGRVTRFWNVTHPPDAVLISRDLAQLRRLSLRFCAWDAIRPGKRVRLNGVDVGELPASARFEPKQVDLPLAAVGALDLVNRVEIEAPGVEASTIGNLQLEGILPGGRIVRTRPTGEVFTWSDRWDPWRLPRLEKVMPGRPLRTLLSFQ